MKTKHFLIYVLLAVVAFVLWFLKPAYSLDMLVSNLVAENKALRGYGNYEGAKYVRNRNGIITMDLPYAMPIVGDKVEVLIKNVRFPRTVGGCKKERDTAVKAQKMIRRQLVKAKLITLESMERDKESFRIIADVLILEGGYLKDHLLKSGLVVRSPESPSWCK